LEAPPPRQNHRNEPAAPWRSTASRADARKFPNTLAGFEVTAPLTTLKCLKEAAARKKGINSNAWPPIKIQPALAKQEETMLDIAPASRGVKPQISDGLCCHNPSELKVRLGQEALARQRRRWEDFMMIAEALDVGRTEVMRDLHANQPTGRRYEKAMGEWLVANGFKDIDKGTRCRLLECLRLREQIERWRVSLTDNERFNLNHPDGVLRKWKASTAIPDPNATPRPSPYAQLKDAHARLIEENHLLQHRIEAADGHLWRPTDTAADIADVMVAKLSPGKAERVAQQMLKIIKSKSSCK
jgi:hypothetical protein